MSDTTIYYQRNREIILNIAKIIIKITKYWNSKARNKYKVLSEEKKQNKTEYGRNRYHNMSEEKKKKEYQKNKDI